MLRGERNKMTDAKKAALILAIFALAGILALSVYAQYEKVNFFKGNVTIGGSSSTDGAVVDAFIGSSSSPAKSYTVGSLPSVGSGKYAVDFSCNSGSAAFLKVWGINATSWTCSDLLVNDTNLSVSLTANDGTCSYANGCSSGICCSGSTAVNSSTSSGVCQAAGCGAGITIPAFSLSASSITTSGTVNFTVNISSVLRYNITSANFTLVTGSTVVSRNFTIPSSGKDFNLSYKIFASSETASAGTYNVTAVQVNDNGSIRNLTAITNMNFTVTAVATTTPDTGGSGPSGGGDRGGTPAPTPAPAPSKETVEAVKEALPATFQVAADAGNVEYKTVAAPEIKQVPAKAEATASAIEYAVDYLVKTEAAQQELGSIQQAVSSGGATTVQASGGSVKKTIEVVEATNKVTNDKVTVSVVKLSVQAPPDKELKNVEVVEVIPKLAASNVNQVTFKGEKPIVLEADPVVKWFFSQISKGQNKDLSYAINKDIRNIGTSTVAVQGRAEAAPPAVEVPPAPEVKKEEKPAAPPAKKPTPLNTMILVVVVAVVVVAAWLFLKGRKKVMK
ncbi:hypothetical protein HYY73_01690 [Candidatus Woesearchaeota archaeon]|nr:hypothetical protein [Candidatus Woesearchaeota archaeon]